MQFFQINNIIQTNKIIVILFLIFFILLFNNQAQANNDFDQDGLSDFDEIKIYYTDPKNSDTDKDNFLDGDEIAHGYDPLRGNYQKIIRNIKAEELFIQNWQGFDNRLPSLLEINSAVYSKRNINLEKKFIQKFTKNNSRLPDNKEIIAGTYGPNGLIYQIDSDNDGLIDDWENKLGSSLVDQDSDKDTYLDGHEVLNGYSPINPNPEIIKKLIKINLTSQKLMYYFDNIKLEEFFISSGIRSMPTPIGKFKIINKIPLKNYGGVGYDFYYPDTKWNMHFYTKKLRFYIHGAYWHNNFGRPMSHGCVNVAYKDMEKLYNWSQIGTEVVIEK